MQLTKEPLELMHYSVFSNENLQYMKQGINDFVTNHPQQRANPSLTFENVSMIKEHKWLTNCNLHLIQPSGVEGLEYGDEALDNLYSELLEKANVISSEVKLDNEYPVISIDLETTGLNKTIKRVGGRNLPYNSIVGVCLGISSTEGYYLPVMHNELDSVKNFKLEDIISFLTNITKNFFCIYHNAVFDQEVMAVNGVRFEDRDLNYTDTMILAILAGYRVAYNQVGLKFLSSTLLKRPMLSISEISEGSEVLLHTAPASNCYVYGSSDAINTYALFYYILESDDNPYETQINATRLDLKSIPMVRSLYRTGLPVHPELTYNSLKTMVRRKIMLENIFYSVVSDSELLISSAEQIGTHIYNLIKSEFERVYNEGKVLQPKDKGFNILTKKLEEDFHMSIKVKTLKSGQKIVAGSSSETIEYLEENLYTWKFVSEDVMEEIYLICEILTTYRSVMHELMIMYKLSRFCYNDDLNLPRVGIGLKLSGANTSRFSNQNSNNGSFDSILLSRGVRKTSTKYYTGDGICGINAQGLSNQKGHWKTFKRVKNFSQLNQEITEKWKTLNNMVEASMQDLFLEGGL